MKCPVSIGPEWEFQGFESEVSKAYQGQYGARISDEYVLIKGSDVQCY